MQKCAGVSHSGAAQTEITTIAGSAHNSGSSSPTTFNASPASRTSVYATPMPPNTRVLLVRGIAATSSASTIAHASRHTSGTAGPASRLRAKAKTMYATTVNAIVTVERGR